MYIHKIIFISEDSSLYVGIFCHSYSIFYDYLLTWITQQWNFQKKEVV